MGQKTHPHGLRVGTHRKWNFSWYGVEAEGKNLYFYQKSVEEFFKIWMSLQAYTKISKIKRVLLVDIKMFKQGVHQFFIFVFFYKLRTKRRKQFVKQGWKFGGGRLKRKSKKKKKRRSLKRIELLTSFLRSKRILSSGYAEKPFAKKNSLFM